MHQGFSRSYQGKRCILEILLDFCHYDN